MLNQVLLWQVLLVNSKLRLRRATMHDQPRFALASLSCEQQTKTTMHDQPSFALASLICEQQTKTSSK